MGVGIIRGADGPTAIYVSNIKPSSVIKFISAILSLIALTALLTAIKIKKNKNV